ncbi:MAG: energy transducer TonB, partial [Porphyromonas sp.]
MAQIEPSAPQRQAIAVASAVLFHVGLLLLLWVMKLSSEHPVPKPTEVLIAVNVGNVASASGAVEP